MPVTVQELVTVLQILRRHVPGREVRAFGSRTHGRNLKPTSDLDLVVMGTGLPFAVDVLNWSAIPSWLQREIARHSEAVHPGESSERPAG